MAAACLLVRPLTIIVGRSSRADCLAFVVAIAVVVVVVIVVVVVVAAAAEGEDNDDDDAEEEEEDIDAAVLNNFFRLVSDWRKTCLKLRLGCSNSVVRGGDVGVSVIELFVIVADPSSRCFCLRRFREEKDGKNDPGEGVWLSLSPSSIVFAVRGWTFGLETPVDAAEDEFDEFPPPIVEFSFSSFNVSSYSAPLT